MRFLLAILFCHAVLHEPLSQKKPTVLVSLAPYVYFVERIAQDTVDIATLVPPTSNPHLFEPTPQQAEKVQKAGLWVRLGEPFEKKMEAILSRHLIQVDVTEGIELSSHSHEGASISQEEGKDRHIWLSPQLAKVQVRAIAAGLSRLLPANAPRYAQNAEALLADLESLSQELTQQLAPLKGRAILVSHPSLHYFCRDFGLVQLSLESEGKEARPRTLALVVEEARRLHVSQVLLQPTYPSKGAEQVAHTLHVPTRWVDPYHPDYLNNLRHIAHTLTTDASTH